MRLFAIFISVRFFPSDLNYTHLGLIPFFSLLAWSLCVLCCRIMPPPPLGGPSGGDRPGGFEVVSSCMDGHWQIDCFSLFL